MLKQEGTGLIVTFLTTAGAIAMEKLCRERGIPGRLIPVPRSITSDCGVAWLTTPEMREAIELAVAGRDIDIGGYYESNW